MPCLLSVVPACLLSHTPYVAYVHIGLSGVYEWFMKTFPIYEKAIGLFYQNAHKIVSITDGNKQDVMKRFNIPAEKIIVINNSINFEEVNRIRTKTENQVKNFLMISRLFGDKKQSLLNGIDLFLAYADTKQDAQLSIIGSGDIQEELQNYIEENNTNQSKIEFLGAKTDVLTYINENDVVLGLDRCIMEAIAMKKIAVITGYEELREILTKENIQEASSENFSGHNLKTKTVEQIVEELNALDKEKIQTLVESNYEFAFNKLNVKKNFYVVEEQAKVKDENVENVIQYLIQMQEELDRIREEDKRIREEDKRKGEELKNMQQWREKQNQDSIRQKERIEALETELSEVYQSKRWQYTDKISKIFH